MKRFSQTIRCRWVLFFLLLAGLFSLFGKTPDKPRLIFEEEKSMRSSFCLYSDGRFYESRPSGCTEQAFSWGYWEMNKDTTILTYQTGDLFRFDVIKSADTANKYQMIKVIDCYGQPVRFQSFYFDTTYQNLYNPGFIQVEKGTSVLYLAPVFGQHEEEQVSLRSNTDTITYKWDCNRETIESVNGGQLYTMQEPVTKKILARNKRVREL